MRTLSTDWPAGSLVGLLFRKGGLMQKVNG